MANAFSTVSAFKNMKVTEGMVVVEGETLRTLQLVLLGIMKDIDDVCERHHIDYFLAGGSLLGAIRHKGFIPWDDDMDICMPRESYERFVKVFPDELGDSYWLHDPRTKKDYSLGMPRVRKKGTVVKGRDDFLVGDETGAFVDIFVVENVPATYIARKAHGLGSLALGFAQSCRKFARFSQQYLALDLDEQTLKVFKTKIRIGRVLSFASMDAWIHAWDSWNSLCKNNQSFYVTVPVGRNHYFAEMMERTDALPTQWVDFEDTQFRAPANYDKYLTQLYGDYMVIPDEGHREAHVVYELDLGDALGAPDSTAGAQEDAPATLDSLTDSQEQPNA